MILKEGYNLEHLYHSETLGGTDDALLLWVEAKTLGGLERNIFFLLVTRQSTLWYQKRKLRCLLFEILMDVLG